MKFRLLSLLIGLLLLGSCNQDDNPTFKGVFSMTKDSALFVTCDGIVITIKKEGEMFRIMKNKYLAFEVKGKPVLVTLKGKVIETLKLKNGKELKDIVVTSLLDMEKGKTCSGKTVKY